MAGFAEIAGLMLLRRGGAVGKSGMVTIVEFVRASHCGEGFCQLCKAFFIGNGCASFFHSTFGASSRDVNPASSKSQEDGWWTY